MYALLLIIAGIGERAFIQTIDPSILVRTARIYSLHPRITHERLNFLPCFACIQSAPFFRQRLLR